MLQQVDYEIYLVQLDFAQICNERAIILTRPQPPESFRKSRSASVGFPSFAAVGFFGGGLAVGGSNSRALYGDFGNCQNQSKANAENVHRLAHFQDFFTE